MFHNQMINFFEWPHIGRGIEHAALVFGNLLGRETLTRSVQDFRSSYRPELHYMRGPGPRWRENHRYLVADDPTSPPQTRVCTQ